MTRGSACAWPIVIEGDLLLLNTALKVHVALTDVGFFIRSTDGISGIFVPLIEEAAQSVTVTLSSSKCVCPHSTPQTYTDGPNFCHNAVLHCADFSLLFHTHQRTQENRLLHKPHNGDL